MIYKRDRIWIFWAWDWSQVFPVFIVNDHPPRWITLGLTERKGLALRIQPNDNFWLMKRVFQNLTHFPMGDEPSRSDKLNKLGGLARANRGLPKIAGLWESANRPGVRSRHFPDEPFSYSSHSCLNLREDFCLLFILGKARKLHSEI